MLALVATVVCCCSSPVELSATGGRSGSAGASCCAGAAIDPEADAFTAPTDCKLCCELEYMRAPANVAAIPITKAAIILGRFDEVGSETRSA